MRPIDAAEAGDAPRLLAGWLAAQAVLDDGEWHDHDELFTAILATGLMPRTAQNILDDARKPTRRPSRCQTTGRGHARQYRLRPEPAT